MKLENIQNLTFKIKELDEVFELIECGEFRDYIFKYKEKYYTCSYDCVGASSLQTSEEQENVGIDTEWWFENKKVTEIPKEEIENQESR